jgi:hypothetical protein
VGHDALVAADSRLYSVGGQPLNGNTVGSTARYKDRLKKTLMCGVALVLVLLALLATRSDLQNEVEKIVWT